MQQFTIKGLKEVIKQHLFYMLFLFLVVLQHASVKCIKKENCDYT